MWYRRFYGRIAKWVHDCDGLRAVREKVPAADKKYLDCLILLRLGQAPSVVCEVERVDAKRLRSYMARYRKTHLSEYGAKPCPPKAPREPRARKPPKPRKEKPAPSPPLLLEITPHQGGMIFLRWGWEEDKQTQKKWRALWMAYILKMPLGEAVKKLGLREADVRAFWEKIRPTL